jgi:hypothetical protein
MPFGTAVPFTPYSGPHLRAIAHSVSPLHTENTRNKALRLCLLRDLWLDDKNRLLAECAGVLKVKRSCCNRHNKGGVKLRCKSVWTLGRMSTSLTLVCGTFAEHLFDNQ